MVVSEKHKASRIEHNLWERYRTYPAADLYAMIEYAEGQIEQQKRLLAELQTSWTEAATKVASARWKTILDSQEANVAMWQRRRNVMEIVLWHHAAMGTEWTPDGQHREWMIKEEWVRAVFVFGLHHELKTKSDLYRKASKLREEKSRYQAPIGSDAAKVWAKDFQRHRPGGEPKSIPEWEKALFG